MLAEGPGGFHEAANIVLAEGEAALERYRLAVILVQLRLGIEGIDAGRSTMHEEKDDPLHACGEVGNFAAERAGRLPGEETLQSEESKAGSGLPKKRTTAGDARITDHLFILQEMRRSGFRTLCARAALQRKAR